MTNLFMQFDPSSWFFLLTNWEIVVWLLGMICLICMATTTSFSSQGHSWSIQVFHTEFSPAAQNGNICNILVPSIMMISMMLCYNTSGLMPYIFTMTSHPAITFMYAFPLWLGHNMMSTLTCFSQLMSRFVPTDAPNSLIPVLIVIEFISSIIRPLTLTVRLAANMIAGHLMVALLGSKASLQNPLLWVVLLILAVLCLLELAVSLIQAYVFALLSLLYAEESSDPAL